MNTACVSTVLGEWSVLHDLIICPTPFASLHIGGDNHAWAWKVLLTGVVPARWSPLLLVTWELSFPEKGGDDRCEGQDEVLDIAARDVTIDSGILPRLHFCITVVSLYKNDPQ